MKHQNTERGSKDSQNIHMEVKEVRMTRVTNMLWYEATGNYIIRNSHYHNTFFTLKNNYFRLHFFN